MENSLLIGLSRQMTLQRKLDVVANNVANVNTTGFKADKSLFEEYMMPVARDDNFAGRDRRVSFVQDRATYHDFSQGPVQNTGNPLDVAVDGGAFLSVQTAAGERYTRDGGLQINERGQLVTTGGHAVLGNNGPIVFQPTDRNITISADGTVTVLEGANTLTDSIRGRLRLVTFDNPQALLKQGSNLFSAGAGTQAQAAPTATVKQGFLEKSNVNAVAEMTQLISVNRAYAQVAAMLQQQGDLRRTAIEKLADVPA